MERVNMTEEMPADDPQMENPTEETSELQQEEQATDRPEWLPDKFGNPEDLAKAYGELERKLSSRDAEEKGLLTESDFDQYQEEYDKNGGLGDETYQTLEKKGISRDLVDSFIQGRELARTQQVNEMYSLAGGEDTYKSMINWAGENMSQDDLDAYNQAVQGDLGVAKLAIKGLYAQYQASGGRTDSSPQLVQGGRGSNDEGYGSNYELMQDMKNPLYKAGDAKFHAMVERKLAKSGNLG
tara:strand:- start:2236 stop:2955 length:720 start_codon:yes stop_codon:yes gene_type:complete